MKDINKMKEAMEYIAEFAKCLERTARDLHNSSKPPHELMADIDDIDNYVEVINAWWDTWKQLRDTE